uniref:(northern house mosquito) hypothetical protein n=1 Tax=Culex pipiens TaxID=7175 RepID=A0A8D8ITP0_CULPI
MRSLHHQQNHPLVVVINLVLHVIHHQRVRVTPNIRQLLAIHHRIVRLYSKTKQSNPSALKSCQQKILLLGDRHPPQASNRIRPRSNNLLRPHTVREQAVDGDLPGFRSERKVSRVVKDHITPTERTNQSFGRGLTQWTKLIKHGAVVNVRNPRRRNVHVQNPQVAHLIVTLQRQLAHVGQMRHQAFIIIREDSWWRRHGQRIVDVQGGHFWNDGLVEHNFRTLLPVTAVVHVNFTRL